MLSSRTNRLAARGLIAMAIIVSATNAFAIRNRYTNEQNEGFAALFYEAFGRPGFAEDAPIRRPYLSGAYRRDDGRRFAPPAY